MKAMFVFAIVLSASMTGALASGLTPEQEARIAQIEVDCEIAAYLSSRCLIDVKVEGPKGTNSEDCQAMVRSVEKVTAHQAFVNSLPQDQKHPAVPKLLRHTEEMTGNLNRLTAILRAYKN